MKSLRKASILALCLGPGTIAAGADGAGDLGPLRTACAPAIARQVALWGDARRWRMTGFWESARGFAWDWDPLRTGEVEHFCARLTLLDGRDRTIDSLTVLCTVTDRGTGREAWTVGNVAAAKRICPLPEGQQARMDAGPVLLEGR
jgi:hypothetical protein